MPHCCRHWSSRLPNWDKIRSQHSLVAVDDIASATAHCSLPHATMGKSQSKLTQEQLADLQKSTYCQYFSPLLTPIASHVSSRQEGAPAVVRPSMLCSSPVTHPPHPGTRASRKTALQAISTRPNSAGYTNSSSRSVIQLNSPSTSSTSSMPTRAVTSTSKNSSAP